MYRVQEGTRKAENAYRSGPVGQFARQPRNYFRIFLNHTMIKSLNGNIVKIFYYSIYYSTRPPTYIIYTLVGAVGSGNL